MLLYIPRRVTNPHITALGEMRAGQLKPGSLEQTLPLSAERLNRDLQAARSRGVPHHTTLTKLQLWHVTGPDCTFGSRLMQQWVQLVFPGQIASTPLHSFFSPHTRGCKSSSVAVIRSWTELRPSFLSGPQLCSAQLRERRENKVFFKSS